MSKPDDKLPSFRYEILHDGGPPSDLVLYDRLVYDGVPAPSKPIERERLGEPPRSRNGVLVVKAGDAVMGPDGVVGYVKPTATPKSVPVQFGGPAMHAELQCEGCKRTMVVEVMRSGSKKIPLCGCGAVIWKTVAVVPDPHRHLSVGFDPASREPRHMARIPLDAPLMKDRKGQPLVVRPEDRIAYFGRGSARAVSEGNRIYDELMLAGHARLREWANAAGLQLCGPVTDEEIRRALFDRLFPADVPSTNESPMNHTTPATKSPVHSCMGLERCHAGCPAFGAWATEQLAIHERRIAAHAPRIAVQCKGPQGCGRTTVQALGSCSDHEGKCPHTWRWAPEMGMKGAMLCTNEACKLVVDYRAIEEVMEQAGLDPSRKYRRGANDLADVAQRTKDENTQLLAENARLRRALEKAGRR